MLILDIKTADLPKALSFSRTYAKVQNFWYSKSLTSYFSTKLRLFAAFCDCLEKQKRASPNSPSFFTIFSFSSFFLIFEKIALKVYSGFTATAKISEDRLSLASTKNQF